MYEVTLTLDGEQFVLTDVEKVDVKKQPWKSYVKVKFLEGLDSGEYAYLDPGWDLDKGDVVRVPVGYSTPTFKPAIILRKGRQEIPPADRDVHSVIVRSNEYVQ